MSRFQRWPVGVGAPLVGLLLVLGPAVAAHASHRTIPRSDASAVAAAISLRQSDLPGSRAESNPQNQQTNDEFINCYGGVPETAAFADTVSPNFVTTGTPSVSASSEAEIFPSAALVAKDLAALRRPHALICLSNQLTSLIRAGLRPGDALIRIHASDLPSIMSGSSDSAAIGISFAFRIKKGATTTTETGHTDSFSFSDGQAEVNLTIGSSDEPAVSLERRLAAALVARARSAIG